ncbi:MAG TPA: hypothetical protein VGG85_15080 [Terracidiphilus sp.]|jgi:hypothetical protein
MKGTTLALSILLAAPFTVCAADYSSGALIPAGSLVQCTVSEPKLSSKTTAIGDPVLCRISHAERYGRSVLPYDSYLVGRFEDYRDPGHFVGKGWMQLSFDRMVIEPDTVVPVAARVVDVPGYVIDRQGRIMGKGHATRDTVEWMIPILWPIDLLNLPRRGPRPTLKEETRLTLKVMDDLRVPQGEQPDRDPYGLYRRPSAAAEPPAPPTEEQQPPSTYQPTAAAPPQPDYAPQPQYVDQQPIYAPPPPVYVAMPMYVMPPPVYVTAAPMYMYVPPPRILAPPMYGPSRTAMVVRGGYAYRVAVP